VGLVLMVLVACSPAAQGPSVQVLPTVAALPSPTPETFTLDSAERVARLFLDAWSRSDFSAMYQLVIFAGREATTQDEFTTLYQNATQTMSLKELEYTIHSQMLDSNQTMVFSYDVTFITDLLGTFT